MSNQIIYLKQLPRDQKKIYKEKLLKQKKSICTGMLCKGSIKSLSKFTHHDNKCNNCNLAEILYKHGIILKYLYMKMQYDKQYNKYIYNKWKDVQNLN